MRIPKSWPTKTDNMSDNIVLVTLYLFEAFAWTICYKSLYFLCMFWEWDIGLEKRLKSSSASGLQWAHAKVNGFKKNGSLLVRKYEQSRGIVPDNYEVPEEWQEVSSPSGNDNSPNSAVRTSSTSQTVADSKGAESHEKPSSIAGSSELKESLEQYATLSKLTDDSNSEAKETPNTEGSDKPPANDAA